jgi:hypothetical protein
MKNNPLKLFYYALTIAILWVPTIVLAKSPVVCESQYALCTTAKCTPIPGNNQDVLCNCQVKTGYSAGFKSCESPKKITDDYQVIKSRYYPIKSYVSCANARAWANCLDSPCIIDKDDPTRASCTCTLVKNKGDYIIVNDSCDKSGCESGIYSSALVSNGMDQFLKDQDKLPKSNPTLCQ